MAAPGPGDRTPDSLALGLARLTHPFPSSLDAVATLALVLIAGGSLATGLRLGTAMYCLQASIGALNDLRDAPADARAKPSKPVGSGVVSPAIALCVVVSAALLGLLLVVPSGPPLLALAAGGLAAGYAYDMWLSGTAASWLPWSVGIPLLPAFAWLGATMRLPDAFVLLLPLAAVAGAALSIGNALADIEVDAESGSRTVAVVVGRERAWRAAVVLHVVVVVGALASLAASRLGLILPGAPASSGALLPGIAGVLAGAALVMAGLGLGSREAPRLRQLGWEIQALGVGLVAVAWIVGIGAS